MTTAVLDSNTEAPIVDALIDIAEQSTNTNTEAPKAEGEDTNHGKAPTDNGEEAAATAAPTKEEIDHDQVTNWLREKGILTEDATLDSLKPKIEKSEDEIKLEERAKNKEVLDEYINNGGTVEDFVKIEKLTKYDEIELGFSAIKQQYKEAGYSEQKIEDLLKTRYFQLSDEDIEELDEDEQNEYKISRELYAKEAQRLGAQIKNEATFTLNNLHESIKARKIETEIEKSILGELEIFAKNAPKHQLKAPENNTDAFKFEDLTLEYSKEEIDAVVSQLKEKNSREKIFYKQDNQAENVTFIAELMLKANKTEKAYQEGVLKGGHIINDFYKKTYLSDKNIQIRQPQQADAKGGGKFTVTGIKQIR